jgi:hypothetical protein
VCLGGNAEVVINKPIAELQTEKVALGVVVGDAPAMAVLSAPSK